jgi:hypothetical protein
MVEMEVMARLTLVANLAPSRCWTLAGEIRLDNADLTQEQSEKGSMEQVTSAMDLAWALIGFSSDHEGCARRLIPFRHGNVRKVPGLLWTYVHWWDLV